MPCPLTPRETPPLTRAALWRTCAARRIRLRRMRLAAAFAAASFVLPALRAARRRALAPLYSPRGRRSRTYPHNSAFRFWSRSACSQTVCLFPVPQLAFRLCPARVNALAIFRKFVCYPVNNRAACKKSTVAFDIVELLFAGTFYTQHQLGRVDAKPNDASFWQNFTHPALKRFDRRQPARTFLPCLCKIYTRKSAHYFSVNTP